MQKTPEEYSDEVTKIETAGEYGDLQLDEVIHIPEGEVCHFVLFKGKLWPVKAKRGIILSSISIRRGQET